MRYSMENDRIRLTADTKGAELVSVQNRETGEEMMWSGDKTLWGRHAPLLFPYPGRLWQDRFELDGKIYEAGKHGFLRDMEFTHLDTPEDRLEFAFSWNEETMKLFPRKFRVIVIFTLDGTTVRQQVQVENLDERELKFGFGYHPGFAFPFDDKHTAEDYEIRFDTPQTPVVVEPEAGYDSGKTHVLMENQTVIPVTDRMFDDDSIGLTDLNARTISLVEKDTGRNITVDIKGFPYVLIWSAPGNPHLHFICLEPWHNIQNPVNASEKWNERPAAAVLQPGDNWNSRLKITFDR